MRQDTARAASLLTEEGTKVSTGAEDVLYQDVDILFPCAVQNVVTVDNVERIRARYICEGANGPVTEAARSSLHAPRHCRGT